MDKVHVNSLKQLCTCSFTVETMTHAHTYICCNLKPDILCFSSHTMYYNANRIQNWPSDMPFYVLLLWFNISKHWLKHRQRYAFIENVPLAILLCVLQSKLHIGVEYDRKKRQWNVYLVWRSGAPRHQKFIAYLQIAATPTAYCYSITFSFLAQTFQVTGVRHFWWSLFSQ
jgi:hypothetical protein